MTAATAAAGLSGCSYPSSGGGGSVVVCGTTLYNEPAGPVPALFGPSLQNRTLHSNTWLYFQVSQGCVHGSHVTWIPRSAARVARAAYASDGLAAAVVLQPTQPYTSYRLVATINGRVVASYTVDPAS